MSIACCHLCGVLVDTDAVWFAYDDPLTDEPTDDCTCVWCRNRIQTEAIDKEKDDAEQENA